MKRRSVLCSAFFIFAAGCNEPPATSSTGPDPDPKPQQTIKTVTITKSETQPPVQIVIPGQPVRIAQYTITNPWQNEETLCVPDVTIRKMSSRPDDTAEISVSTGKLTVDMKFDFTLFWQDEQLFHVASPQVPCVAAGESGDFVVVTKSAPLKAEPMLATDARSGDSISIEIVDAKVISLANPDTVIGRSIFVEDGIETDGLPGVTHVLRAGMFGVKPKAADPTVQPDGGFEAMSWMMLTSQHGTAIGLDGWGFTFPTATLETPLALLRDGVEIPATFTVTEVGEGVSTVRVTFDEIILDPMSASVFSFRWNAQPGVTTATVPLAFDYQEVNTTAALDCNPSDGMLKGVPRSAAVWSDLTAQPHTDCITGSPSADFIGDGWIRGIAPGAPLH